MANEIDEQLFKLANGTVEFKSAKNAGNSAVMINVGTATVQPFARDRHNRTYNIEAAVQVGNGKVIFSRVPIDGVVITAAAGVTADSYIRLINY